MADKPTVTEAKEELQSLYLGIPNDSVDLTFKDMVSFQQSDATERHATEIGTVNKNLTKTSSLDFSKALQGNKAQGRRSTKDELCKEDLARNSFRRNDKGLSPLAVESGQAYNNASVLNKLPPLEGKGGRKRPGTPHSNICAFCSDYIYFFRNRCLVRHLRTNFEAIFALLLIPVIL